MIIRKSAFDCWNYIIWNETFIQFYSIIILIVVAKNPAERIF